MCSSGDEGHGRSGAYYECRLAASSNFFHFTARLSVAMAASAKSDA